MKKIIIALPLLMLQACAYNSTMGQDDRFQVATTASLFAPSVTTVVDTKNPDALPSTYAGPSIAGQIAQAAGTTAAGAFVGHGLGKSGTQVNQHSGGASSSSVSGAVSSSKSTQLQGQGQTLGGHHNDGLEINH